MIAGAFVVGLCFLLLGWTKELVSVFGGSEEYQKSASIFTAVFIIYAVDFAINVVQACCRSLIVDTLPISLQESGSAWASRVGGFGSLLSYGVGTLDLVSILPTWLGGDTQFKKMTTISVLMLWTAVGITTSSVTERVLIASPDQGQTIRGILLTLWQRTFNLPARIQAICWAQFWSWIGFFPFLFYGSTWVGEMYYRYEHKPDPGEDNHDALGNIGRIGSLSLVLYSIVNFTASVLLPHAIESMDSKRKSPGRYTPRPPQSLPGIVQKSLRLISQLPRPDLVTAWLMAHIAFASIMVWAPLIRSLSAATFLVAVCGVPMAISSWAPFAEIGIEINRLATGSLYQNNQHGKYRSIRASIDDDDDDVELTSGSSVRPRSTSLLRLLHPDSDDGAEASTGELAGVYLGVLNVYTTLPQFIGTFISWIVFSIFEPNQTDLTGEDPDHHRWLDVKGVNAISVCFLVGAFSALAAAEATRRLKRLGRD